MSEEFDKEAEREKLREKLEKDERKRQETQRMSELLLQGATMTNDHCDRCGDPLFRDGGETFCPTCGGDGAEAAEGAATGGGEAVQQPQEQQSVDQQPAEQQAAQPPASESPTTQRGDGAPTPAGVDARRQEPTAAPPADDPRGELRRAVTTTARKANEATDPRTAKQWLEASKEAAEALEALGE
ncbi:MAG: Sjogren's syndrome/scleroderma autoantigen 1 family protein [Halolamina sp.]